MWLTVTAFARFIGLFLLTAGIIVVGLTAGGAMTAAERHLVGYAGTAFILLAQLYALRKKFPALARLGPLKLWMERHQTMTLVGAALVVVHAGGGDPPRGLALMSFILMLATVLSGLVGAWIHSRAVKAKSQLRAELKQQGVPAGEIEDRVFLVSMTESTFRYWRTVHAPITVTFFATLVLHVAAMIFFGGVLNE